MRALLLLAAVLTLAACDTNGDGIPRTAVITRVVVEEAPLADPNGDGWDGGSNPLSDGPEVYFRLFDAFVDYQTGRTEEPTSALQAPYQNANASFWLKNNIT